MSKFELVLVFRGAMHDILIPPDLAEEFLKWLKRLQRPEQRILQAVFQRIADTPFARLAFNQEYWKLEVKAALPLYAIRKDQARVYCALQGRDIVILDWDQKQQRKANPVVLDRALRRAKEYGLDSGKGD